MSALHRRHRIAASLLLIIVLGQAAAAAHEPGAPDEPGPVPPISGKVEGLDRLDGFLPLYWDARTGRLWMEIERFDEDILHYVTLPAGVGSNDIGLSRGQLGPRRVVRFRRVGPKVLLVQPNYAFRAGTDDPAEQLAVEEAFPVSVLHGFEVTAETDGRVLVDATGFVLGDAHDVAGALRRTGQGRYRLDPSRSALHLPRTRGFPDNTEIEVTLTFVADPGEAAEAAAAEPGAWISGVAPTPGAVTVRQHHSFVRLPDAGCVPRPADPRAGYFGIAYTDFAAPLGQPMQRRLIARHRLEKHDPSAEVSEAVEPIVYYLDPAVPEPVRSALRDGALWWNEAFEAIGYRGAFQVRPLPEGADPMDVRYNVIQWVHRATRGWSFGGTVLDPRTGEILKGHVSLGSLRVRQDYLLAEGLLAPYERGDERPGALTEMALARIRQLSAHEVGHTLGLQHNYLASAQGPDGRASVMDYPHPLTRLREDGTIDLAAAYDTGVGEWDRVAIAYGYGDVPEGADEGEALAAILTEARERGLTFLSDGDARPRGSAHPQAHLWDNGVDAVLELERVMDVRRAALARFGERALPAGRALAELEEVLVPVYLHHRYQTEAAVKAVGGLYYEYAFRGDGVEPLRPVPAAEQKRALEAVLRTLRPSELTLPAPVLDRLPPRPALVESHRELFRRYTGLVFDPLAPAEAAADLGVSLLLDPERAARLVAQAALDPSLPGLGEVLDRLVAATFEPAARTAYEAAVGRSVQWVVAERLIGLASDAPMPQVRALTTFKLAELTDRLAAHASDSQDERAHRSYLAERIGRFLERRHHAAAQPEPLPLPPGSPI